MTRFLFPFSFLVFCLLLLFLQVLKSGNQRWNESSFLSFCNVVCSVAWQGTACDTWRRFGETSIKFYLFPISEAMRCAMRCAAAPRDCSNISQRWEERRVVVLVRPRRPRPTINLSAFWHGALRDRWVSLLAPGEKRETLARTQPAQTLGERKK